MFVEKWWAIWTKLPSLGEHWVSSWVWIQQQPVIVACWLSLSIAHGNLSPFLPWSGDTRDFWGADCCFFWSQSRSTMLLLTGDPFFCTSWLRILSGRDAPRLVWQDLALFSWAAPGLSTGLAALSLHQGYSTVGLAKESPVKLAVFKEVGLDLPDQARWKLRWIRKKNLPSHKLSPVCVVVRDRWAQTFPVSPRRTKLAQVMQRLACAWKSHPYFHVQMAGDTTGIKDKWNILVF